jgi:hypothetical protein
MTLIEVMIALVVTSIILVGARLALEMLADASHRSAEAAREADRVANADRVERSLFRMLEIGPGLERPFGGDTRSAHFFTWCHTPGGWLERCHAVLAIERSRDTNVLVAHMGAQSIRLASGFRDGSLRYLNNPALSGQWFVRWGDGNVPPLAVGVVLDGDTSILPIGERR